MLWVLLIIVKDFIMKTIKYLFLLFPLFIKAQFGQSKNNENGHLKLILIQPSPIRR